MPRGLSASRERDPRNFTRAEWEQARSAKQDPKALKAMFQQCWAASDSGQAYKAALAERGYALAVGDRRSIIAIDFRGQVYAVSTNSFAICPMGRNRRKGVCWNGWKSKCR